jgi:hypothetical protein
MMMMMTILFPPSPPVNVVVIILIIIKKKTGRRRRHYRSPSARISMSSIHQRRSVCRRLNHLSRKKVVVVFL